MRAKRFIFWMGKAMVVLLGLALGFYFFVLDWQGRPFCHKQIMFGFLGVMHPPDEGRTQAKAEFPNVRGLGQDSLAAVGESMGG